MTSPSASIAARPRKASHPGSSDGAGARTPASPSPAPLHRATATSGDGGLCSLVNMREELDRRAMATLSGGHLAVDFASGSVPALLPFFVLEFDLSYTATAVLMLAVLASSSFVQPLFGLWSGPAGCDLAPAGRSRALRGRHRARGRRAELRPDRRARLPRRHRDRRVPPGGRQVRRLCERPEARERHVSLQHRREHRLCARADRRHAARALARPRRRSGRDAPDPRRSPLPAPLAPDPGAARAEPSHARHGARRGRRARNDAARRGDRAPERGLVRVADVRAALGRGRRRHGRGGQSRALADARRRRRRDTRARARRRSRRASADPAHHPGRAAVPDRSCSSPWAVSPERSR